MLATILNVAFVAVAPPVFSALWAHLLFGSWRTRFYFGWLWGAVSELSMSVTLLSWPLVLASAGSALLALLLWWLSGRRRKRAPRHYGAKSKAALAALVRRAREAARPRERATLRPVPG